MNISGLEGNISGLENFGSWDVEALTRLANQFFNEQPGGAPVVPDWARDVPLRYDVPLGRTIAPVVPLPDETELQALLESILPTVRSWAAPHVFRSPSSVPSAQGFAAPFDVQLVRQDFPILQERINGRQLVWLDNAATTQKPQAVIDRLKYFYEHENSNIHRAAHELAARATDAYEEAREKVRNFLHASSVKEIVFVRGATEAINLGTAVYRQGRRDRRHLDGASREYCAVAAARQ
jgi:hypothetical protein